MHGLACQKLCSHSPGSPIVAPARGVYVSATVSDLYPRTYPRKGIVITGVKPPKL